MTDIEEQAQKMAIRVARIYRKTPTVNVYEIDDNMALISMSLTLAKSRNRKYL